jgi:hypothetical protein
MSKRCSLLAATCLASLIGLLILVVALLPRPGVTAANFDRLAAGMSLAEVDEVVGAQFKHDVFQAGLAVGQKRVSWHGEFSVIVSVFDERDRLVEKDFADDSPPFYAGLRRKFPWLPPF